MTSPAARDLARASWRLRRGTPVVEHGAGEVLLGTDPRWSLVLAGLRPGEAGWLRETSGRPHRTLERTARRWDLDPDRRARLEDLLARSGLLVPEPPPGPDVPPTRAGDAVVLGALRADDAGAATLAARTRRAVGVAGLGRLGAALAEHLATAGVGTLVLDDREPVQVLDLGVGGYEQPDVGRPRERALRARLGARHPATQVFHTLDRDLLPEVVVVVEAHAPDPGRYDHLLGAGVAHLPVVVREADVVVGPFVLPGVSPCVRCDERHATDADDRWPAAAAALRRSGGRAAPHETTLAACAAALAAGQVLAHLDGHRPLTAGGVLETSLPDAVPRLRRLAGHPACGCLRLPR
ncbi:ThiF family adenylyltransferase [Isoptericola sp. BMS4]|uniref:ThiF family adenylyltransferase n=1 Tax=Isoptericola sp. BMS4 TaxID=2527875 RepID=UPI001423A824|nr:ThiF family adenylyltransferase [Isoptericola sp. BMS4]